MFFYLYISGDSYFMQFDYRLIVHQRPLNYNRCKLHNILMVFDGLSNDTEIVWNLNHCQSKIEEHTHTHTHIYIYMIYPIFMIIFIFTWRSIVNIVKITNCQGLPSQVFNAFAFYLYK
jgi:hypothetical protein